MSVTRIRHGAVGQHELEMKVLKNEVNNREQQQETVRKRVSAELCRRLSVDAQSRLSR